MKISYNGIVRTKDSENPEELVAIKDLSAYSRFTRAEYGSFMTVFATIAAGRTPSYQRKTIEKQGSPFHTYSRAEAICGIIIPDDQYPAIVAQILLSEILEDFMVTHPQSTWAAGTPNLNAGVKANTEQKLQGYLSKYQDPTQVDAILKIQKELDDTQIILHKTFESVLQRGEKRSLTIWCKRVQG